MNPFHKFPTAVQHALAMNEIFRKLGCPASHIYVGHSNGHLLVQVQSNGNTFNMAVGECPTAFDSLWKEAVPLWNETASNDHILEVYQKTLQSLDTVQLLLRLTEAGVYPFEESKEEYTN